MSNKGFSLIELMVAIAIIAVVAAVVVPNLTQRSSAQERSAFITQLTALTQFAARQAIVTGKIHRITVDATRELASLSVASDKKDTQGTPIFIPAQGYSLKTTAAWPKKYVIKNFFIEGFDEMTRFTGRTTTEMWFYVLPEGVAQSVIINIVDVSDKQDGKGTAVSLVLNPFNARFKEYDTFQKP